MNDIFDYQKEKIVAIKHEISLLHQQINYLLRNEKALGLLDLDVLMNRTHTIYDQLCAIHLGEEATEDDFDLDADALAGLFGNVNREENDNAQQENETENDSEPILEPEMENTEEDRTVIEPEMPNVVEPEVVVEAETSVEEMPSVVVENQVVEHQDKVEESKAPESPLGDEFGFFFRFEGGGASDEDETAAVDTPVEKDGKLVHTLEVISEEDIPERDLVHGDELVTDNPLEMPKMEDEPLTDEIPEVEPEKKTASETTSQPLGGLSSYFTSDDSEFELSTPETLGERMMRDDHSLAAKFQQKPVRDLKAVIGINEKFLFVNELFGGSMEKYNKSIENLNDLKTLNGAMIYLNELKIELQWNSSNEAYQKLSELVRRKFEQS